MATTYRNTKSINEPAIADENEQIYHKLTLVTRTNKQQSLATLAKFRHYIFITRRVINARMALKLNL